MTEKERVTVEKFGNFVMRNNVSKTFLVEIFKLAGNFLNIQTISDYSRTHNISYQGTKKCRNTEKIFGVSWIIDND